ncbi:hypothetical protein RB653_002389 [Dictyostelium firmibasis]|uniref:Large ribosomal subunit protein mL49 n=1 Tax=Dictyostelium firmibasis TaxID=79012 RepID=A0AAN7TXP7_9MYCE
MFRNAIPLMNSIKQTNIANPTGVAQHRLLKSFRDTNSIKPEPRPDKIFKIDVTSPLKFPIDPVSSQVLYGPKSKELKYPEIPFIVNRTPNGKLPIYSDILRGHSVQYTILKNFKGDTDVLVSELEKIFGESTVIRNDTSVRIKGNHSKTILVWLTGLGF